jgi:hypothetical protein
MPWSLIHTSESTQCGSRTIRTRSDNEQVLVKSCLYLFDGPSSTHKISLGIRIDPMSDDNNRFIVTRIHFELVGRARLVTSRVHSTAMASLDLTSCVISSNDNECRLKVTFDDKRDQSTCATRFDSMSSSSSLSSSSSRADNVRSGAVTGKQRRRKNRRCTDRGCVSTIDEVNRWTADTPVKYGE